MTTPLATAKHAAIRAHAHHRKACSHEQLDEALSRFAAHCTKAQRHRIQDMRRILHSFAVESPT